MYLTLSNLIFTLKREHILPKKKVILFAYVVLTTLTINFVLVNKQINDKERISAAMENPRLKEMVENCIKEEDWYQKLLFQLFSFKF